MVYRGSCHCGQVAFEVEATIDAAVDCNCSICARKGALLASVSHDKLRLLSGADGMGSYIFNKHAIAHRFCRSCGIHLYAEDVAAGGERNAYVNLRCLDGLDLAALPVMEFDGRAL